MNSNNVLKGTAPSQATRGTDMNMEIQSDLPCCLTDSHDCLVVSNRDRHGQPLRTVINKESGLVFTDPRLTEEEIRKFYSEDYRKNYKGILTPKPKHILRAGRLAHERLDEIKEFLKPQSSLLDVGSGGGEFVYTCQSTGLDAHGIEPNQGYANFSVDAYGIDVACNFFDEVQFKEESFDCITMFHVLEHLEDPVGSVRLLSRFLRPEGHFVIEVPNVDYTETAPNQKWHLGHLYNFNLQTLQAAGIRAGLEPIRTYYTGFGSSLFTVFQKTCRPLSCSVEEILEGSFEATSQILKRHTTINHFLNLHIPIRRCFSKFYRTINERIRVRQNTQPKEILDALCIEAMA